MRLLYLLRRRIAGSPLWLWLTALACAVAMGLYASPAADGAAPDSSTNRPAHRSEWRWYRPCHDSNGPGPCFWNGDHRGANNTTSYHLDRRERAYVPTKDINGHDGCWILIDDPSRVRCDDGYRLTVR